MKALLVPLAITLLLAGPARADGKIYVPLPDLSGVTGAEAEALLHDVVRANVVSSNCPGFEISEEEWSLLTDSADMLARGQLGLGVEDYDRIYYGPAFAALDWPETCAEAGPQVQPTIARLVALGGSREPLGDQEAGYAAEQARQAAWDAADKDRGKQRRRP